MSVGSISSHAPFSYPASYIFSRESGTEIISSQKAIPLILLPISEFLASMQSLIMAEHDRSWPTSPRHVQVTLRSKGISNPLDSLIVKKVL